AGWPGHHAGADVPPRAHGDRLPGAGAVGVPQAHGRGERAGDSRDPAARRRGAGGPSRAPARRARHQTPAAPKGVPAVGRRAASAGDYPRARHRAQIHAVGRAVRRRRSDRRARHPDHRGGPAAPGHRRAHHRSQRGADARHRGPRVHHVRRQSAGRRHRARAGVRRPRSEPLPRAHPHGTLARAPRGGPTPTRMKTGLQQHIGLSQQLRINPRLYQAMDLLYMPLLDLQQHLKQELLNNPFLELEEPQVTEEETQPDTLKLEKEKEAAKDEIDWEEILLDGFDAGGRRAEYEEKEYYEPVTVDTRDLYDHLRDQLTLMPLAPRQMLMGEEIIGNIDENGYLTCPMDDV